MLHVNQLKVLMLSWSLPNLHMRETKVFGNLVYSEICSHRQQRMSRTFRECPQALAQTQNTEVALDTGTTGN